MVVGCVSSRCLAIGSLSARHWCSNCESVSHWHLLLDIAPVEWMRCCQPRQLPPGSRRGMLVWWWARVEMDGGARQSSIRPRTPWRKRGRPGMLLGGRMFQWNQAQTESLRCKKARSQLQSPYSPGEGAWWLSSECDNRCKRRGRIDGGHRVALHCGLGAARRWHPCLSVGGSCRLCRSPNPAQKTTQSTVPAPFRPNPSQ